MYQVIHGERFSVMTVNGCDQHPYIADYNREVKEARKGRSNIEIRWKQSLQDFKANYEAAKRREAEKLEALQKRVGMTGHQRRTMLARQDDMEYQQRKEREAAGKASDILGDTATRSSRADPRHLLRSQFASLPEVAVRQSSVEVCSSAELAVSIGAVTREESMAVLTPLWLYDELFADLDAGREQEGKMEDWVALDQHVLAEKELAVPTAEWLRDELYREPEDGNKPGTGHNAEPPVVTNSPNVPETGRSESASAEARPRRKENKKAKRQRAAESRALARTLAEDAVGKDDEEGEFPQLKKARKALVKKGSARAGMTSFT